MSARKQSASAAQPVEVQAVPRFAVTFPRGLNLREGPGRQHKVVTVLPMGTVVLAAGAAEEGWLPVACDLGAGWVDIRYLAPAGG